MIHVILVQNFENLKRNLSFNFGKKAKVQITDPVYFEWFTTMTTKSVKIAVIYATLTKIFPILMNSQTSSETFTENFLKKAKKRILIQ